MSLIITPIKEDLQISDFQASLLLGFAFSALFSIASIPAGHLVDILSRKKMLAWSVTAWSAMAALCGLSVSYAQLFLGRMGLGVCESGATPAAISMIRDIFPAAQRGKAFALFHATPLIGGGGALMFGGLLLAIAGRGGFEGVPLIGELKPWQIVMIIHAGLGIPILLLLLTLREPARRVDGASPASFGEAFRFVRREWGVFAPLWIGSTLLMAAQGGRHRLAADRDPPGLWARVVDCRQAARADADDRRAARRLCRGRADGPVRARLAGGRADRRRDRLHRHHAGGGRRAAPCRRPSRGGGLLCRADRLLRLRADLGDAGDHAAGSRLQGSSASSRQ